LTHIVNEGTSVAFVYWILIFVGPAAIVTGEPMVGDVVVLADVIEAAGVVLAPRYTAAVSLPVNPKV
jgi:hypothetical protein